MRRSCILALLVLSLGRPACAETAAAESFDWKPWRSLAVQDHGRQKPLDSLAWETWRIDRQPHQFHRPETGQKLDATALYLSMLLDWQGWDKPPNPLPRRAPNPHQMAECGGGLPAMPQGHTSPDKWDRWP